MAVCPSCRRPVAVARDRCLYCGEILPPHLVPERPAPGRVASRVTPAEAASPESEEANPDRTLLVLDLDAAGAGSLEGALGLSAYEADLLARRGGFHLHRIMARDLAQAEARRLREEGLTVETLLEDEIREQPLRAVGGDRGNGILALITEEEPIALRPEDRLIVVRGTISRQYQPVYRRRRVDTASLEEGYRVHLHPRSKSHSRAVEIDCANFEFGFAVTGSTRLEIDAWVEEVGDGVPRDDGFRRLPPAYGVAEPEPRGPLSAAGSLGRASRGRDTTGEGECVVLDNAAQFRFYSAWRAALERQRAG